ncbi:MAG: ATP-binding protein [Selenomonadales bacterium]|nr:ATP-binding protein [Selenomonadales bacterium]
MHSIGAVLEDMPNMRAVEQELLGRGYMKNGILYCKKCHTPMMIRKVMFGRLRTLPVVCKCRVLEIAKERAEEEKRKAAELRKDLRRMAMNGRDMKEWTFAKADDTKVIRQARRYAENFAELKKRGKGLLLYGDCGVGKTYAAACIVNALVDSGVPCLMTSFSRVLNALWSVEDKQAYIDSLNQVDLLVIDDLGAERQSEYVAEQVFNIIDTRSRAKLPMIVTTNLTLREMTTPSANKRIYERILGRCHPVEVTGENRRRQELKDDFTEMNDMLGE